MTLCSNFYYKDYTFKSEKCYLNPTFGDASNLVGGADADIILDDMLIDIKTTKAISFTQEHYNQFEHM